MFACSNATLSLADRGNFTFSVPRVDVDIVRIHAARQTAGVRRALVFEQQHDDEFLVVVG